MEKLEKERKFLIETPLSWVGRFKVFMADNCGIYQTYLNEPDVDGISRIRFCTLNVANCGYRSKFYYTTKKFITDGVCKENEVEIDSNEYKSKYYLRDKTKKIIIKKRYYIDFDDRTFELDIYEDYLAGLVILEIELENMEEKIILPPYLKVVREVTNERFYSNHSLSGLNSYAQMKLGQNQMTNIIDKARRDAYLEKVRFPRRID